MNDISSKSTHTSTAPNQRSWRRLTTGCALLALACCVCLSGQAQENAKRLDLLQPLIQSHLGVDLRLIPFGQTITTNGWTDPKNDWIQQGSSGESLQWVSVRATDLSGKLPADLKLGLKEGRVQAVRMMRAAWSSKNAGATDGSKGGAAPVGLPEPSAWDSSNQKFVAALQKIEPPKKRAEKSSVQREDSHYRIHVEGFCSLETPNLISVMIEPRVTHD